MAFQNEVHRSSVDNLLFQIWKELDRLSDNLVASGGGVAPTNASYVTLGTNATLTSERVLTAGTGITISDGGAGSTVTINATAGVSGWTDDGTDVRLTTITDQVGIGIANATSKLHVVETGADALMVTGVVTAGKNAYIEVSDDLYGGVDLGVALVYDRDSATERFYVGAGNIVATDRVIMGYTDAGATQSNNITVEQTLVQSTVLDSGTEACGWRITDPEGVIIAGKDTGSTNMALTVKNGNATPFGGSTLASIRNDGATTITCSTPDALLVSGVSAVGKNTKLEISDNILGNGSKGAILSYDRSSASQVFYVMVADASAAGGTETLELGYRDLTGTVVSNVISIIDTGMQATVNLDDTTDVGWGITEADGTTFLSKTSTSANNVTKWTNVAGAQLGLVRGDGLAQFNYILAVGGNATSPGIIRMLEDSDNGTNHISITAPSTIVGDKTQTLQDLTGSVALIGVGAMVVNAGGFAVQSGTNAATATALIDPGIIQAGVGLITLSTGNDNVASDFYHRITIENNNDGIQLEAKNTDTSAETTLRLTPSDIIFTGLTYGTNWHNNAAANGSTTQQDLRSGTWSPTRSAEANLDSNVTFASCKWSRVGNIVSFSGRFTGDPTLTATSTSFEFTLPVTSNIAVVGDVSGTATCGVVAGMSAEITGSVANNTGVVTWVASDVASRTWSFSGQYEVLA